jgi:predicted DNA binding CopG/RHH family protein
VKNDIIQEIERGEKRMKKRMGSDETAEAKYYDAHGVLKEMIDEPIEMSLDTELRRAILSGKRRRNLKNISLKMDPLQIQAIKKVATMKSIPYQTLIRHWLSENLKKELHIT